MTQNPKRQIKQFNYRGQELESQLIYCVLLEFCTDRVRLAGLMSLVLIFVVVFMV